MKDIFDEFVFEPELEEASEIFCPQCEEWSFQEDWYETEVGCEDCGSHRALGCPKCEIPFDTVYYGDEWHPFKTRTTTP